MSWADIILNALKSWGFKDASQETIENYFTTNRLKIRNKSTGHLDDLTFIFFNKNLLKGNIYDGLCKLKNLRHLDLSENKLFGTLPESIGDLTNLTHLHLNNNKLEGIIPNSFIKLKNLISLNLRYRIISFKLDMFFSFFYSLFFH